jgi:hypothetical protein
MPNAFAFIVVFSWPLAVYVLFRFLPRIEALGWSIVAGYLLLPTRAGMDFPLIPLIDKDAIPGLAAAVALAFGMGANAAKRAESANINKGDNGWGTLKIFMPFLFILLASPVITVLTNSETLVYGPIVLPALRIYDALSIIGRIVFTVLPFLLAARYLASPESHAKLLKVIVLAMLAYTLPMLFEIRMSPQLNVMFYGFFPHEFLQHMRGGSFRPVVFLYHGLWVAILMAMAIVGAVALWRQRIFEGSRAGQWLFSGLYLLLVLFMSSNLGALAIAVGLVPAALLLGARGQVLLAGAISLVVLLYPVLRSTDLVPVDKVVEVAERINPDRAASLQYRLDNEDALGAKAAEKPFAGWGIWGRNQIFDPDTGRVLSVTDGAWIIIIGVYGWLGYIAQFGLLTLPTILLAFGRRSAALTPATAGLTLVMGANLFDLLPNATLTPITWLVGGALAGFCVYRAPEQAPENGPIREMPQRSWGLLTDRPKQAQAKAQGAVPEWHGPSRPARRMGREDA